MQRFTDWLTLCEILAGFSAQLLASFGYDPRLAAFGEQFLAAVAAEPEAAASEYVVRALRSLAAVSPELGTRARQLAEWARADLETTAPPVAPGETRWDLRTASEEEFDVARMLADL